MKPFLKVILLGASCCVPAAGQGFAQAAGGDESPPIVTIAPKQAFQSQIFQVVLGANKPSAIRIGIRRPGETQWEMGIYRDPVTITDEGATTVFYYAEDLSGRKSVLDSMAYTLDIRSPELTIRPDPGHFQKPLTVRFICSKPCRFYLHTALGGGPAREIPESLIVKDSLSGFVSAVDKAGNIVTSAPFAYIVDSSPLGVSIKPDEGIYNKAVEISFSTDAPESRVYYTFDPSAPPQLFTPFQDPVALPSGNTIVRFYAKNSYGWESEIRQAAYVVDTLRPRIYLACRSGDMVDTVLLSAKPASAIRFTLDGSSPELRGTLYQKPIAVPGRGGCVLKAIAKDAAGNSSELFEWDNKYEAPSLSSVRFSEQGGLFNAPLHLTVKTDNPAPVVVYTLDGSKPTLRSSLYKDEIFISKEGTTTLRAIAVDENGNLGPESVQQYVLDTRPPLIRAKIDDMPDGNGFTVALSADKEATIYYETGPSLPTASSPVYSSALSLHRGQTLRYFAVDKAGNKSEVRELDEIKIPGVGVNPRGGVFRRPVKVTFPHNEATRVFWRMMPDSIFKPFVDSIALNHEGTYSIEYYAQAPGGMKSPFHAAEYTLDMTAPRISVNLQRGLSDSVTVFFRCSKNASIYCTIDGSSPLNSPTTKRLGDKLHLSESRISIAKKDQAKLAYFAEDAAGNRSEVAFMDVFKPRAFPSVPPGNEFRYDHILSLNLTTYDVHSRIFYSRHGRAPTTDSAVFFAPILLSGPDTLITFVVDPLGYKGDLDTFIYHIDLRPVPGFSVAPDSGYVGAQMRFDASATIGGTAGSRGLLYRWDFNGDGVFETDFSANARATHVYQSAGIYKPVLEVKSEGSLSATASRNVVVRPQCPREMSAVVLPSGGSFCIDKFEWPNIAGQFPTVGRSWVEAKMKCLDAGKRLCTPEEWIGACRGPKGTAYPYGGKYEKNACASEGQGPQASGSFSRCDNGLGAYDMVGNVWEWVDGKKGDYPRMFGGSYKYGESADCGLSSQGSVGTKSNEVGFRCCK